MSDMGFFGSDHAQAAHGQVYGGGKSHGSITHELLAGAVGFEAMRMFEHHEERKGKVEHHELAKELLAGFVAAELDKHFEQGSFGHLDRGQAMRMAQEQAQGLLNHRRR
jgi:Protein of unknown function (DUF3759)